MKSIIVCHGGCSPILQQFVLINELKYFDLKGAACGRHGAPAEIGLIARRASRYGEYQVDLGEELNRIVRNSRAWATEETGSIFLVTTFYCACAGRVLTCSTCRHCSARCAGRG